MKRMPHFLFQTLFAVLLMAGSAHAEVLNYGDDPPLSQHREEYAENLKTLQEDADKKVLEAKSACGLSPGSTQCQRAQAAATAALAEVSQQANVIARNEYSMSLDGNDTHTDVANAQAAADQAARANETCARNFGAENCVGVLNSSVQANTYASQAVQQEQGQAQDSLDIARQAASEGLQQIPDGPEKDMFTSLANQANALTTESSVEELTALSDAINAVDCSTLPIDSSACYNMKVYLSSELAVLLDQKAKACAASGSSSCVNEVKELCDNLVTGVTCGLGDQSNQTQFDKLVIEAKSNQPFVCTTDDNFVPKPNEPSIIDNILTSLMSNVILIMDDSVDAFYNAITQDGAFGKIVGALMILFVIFYAVGFLFGIVGLTLEEGITRLVKIGVILALFSPTTGWDFFYGTAGKFFVDGTNQILNHLTETASELFTGPAQNQAVQGKVTVSYSPLQVLESSLRQVFSVKMGVAIMALLFSGYFGMAHAILLIVGIILYLRFMLHAIWIFMMSIVVKGLLFALAPFFITFMLFKKTMYLFEGWLTQLVSYTLQPILLFMFLGFFSVFITASLNAIMNVELCWVPITLGDIQGSFWRFMDEGANGSFSLDSNTWNSIAGDIANDAFPVKLIDILIFVIISYVAWGASKIAVQIAEGLADGVSLSNIRGSMGSYVGDMVDSGKTWAFRKITGGFGS